MTYDSEVGYPPYTTKQQLIREFEQAMLNVPNRQDLLYRLNNTDFTGLSDGDTRYNPASSWDSGETIT